MACVFCPQGYTPGQLSLTISKEMAKGEYTSFPHVRGNVANQNYYIEHKPTVE
jgi:hypothetical protein